MTARPPGEFASTHWSIVREARSDHARRREALESLCRTYWPPVYSYLRRRGHSPADVFMQQESGDPGHTPGPEEIFLNNALLENGHAVRKDAWEFGDWVM
ncbi:MAG: hypothetical protein EXS32_17565 [Opitutus sp.]|nr:hypothetical protein [Opitutus sp.]